MSSITTRSTSTAGLSASTAPVTAAQEAAQARISAAQMNLKSANEEVQARQSEVDRAESDVQKYASKGPKDKNYQAAIATRNIAYQNLDAAKQRQQRAQTDLQTAKDALPAAIQVDKQATDAARAREASAEDRTKTQARDAQEAKEESDKSKAEPEGAEPQGQVGLQAKGKKLSAADVVGSAAMGGGESEAAPKGEKTTATGAAPQEAGDGYMPSSAAPAAERRSGSQSSNASPSALTDEETQQASGAPARSFVATSGKATKNADPTAKSGAEGAAPVTVGEVPITEGQITDDLVTDSGLKFSDLTPAQRDVVAKTVKAAKAAAREGNVKRVEDAIRDGIMEMGQTSGIAADDDTVSQGTGKGDKKVSGKSVGAAGKGKSAGGTTTIGSAPNTLTAAGNGAASAAAGATGSTVGAVDRPAIQELAAAQSGKPMVGASVQGNVAKAFTNVSDKVATVGASGSDINFSSGSAGVNTEIGKAYSGGMSPMELVQMVMLKAFQESGEEVRNAAELLKKQTDAKQTAREGQNSLRSLVSYDSRGVLSSTNGSGDTPSAKTASDMLQSIDGNIDAIGDDNQILMIRLQNLTQLMTTMSQAASNMSKSQFDTTKSVIGQIGH